VSIDNFLKKIADRGGIATSNSYDVQFNLTSEVKAAVSSYYNEEVIKLLCDEAQLPNVSTATTSMKGRYLGLGEANYASTRTFSTFQLGFILTADLMPLKFLQSWNDFIFGEHDVRPLNANSVEGLRTTDRLNKRRPTKLAYPDEYRCEVRILKTEPGPKSMNERGPIVYVMENCWPSEIDAVPLSYGSTQVTKVTAQFQYERHYVIMNDDSTRQYKKVNTLYDSEGRYIGVSGT